MSDINLASVNAGSAINPNLGPNGEPNFDYKTAYEEAQKLIGANSGELGEYRSFFKEVQPILETLDKQDPVLVKAILDGKIDDKLAQAVIEGKVSVGEANAVINAEKAVKKEIGTKEYNNLSSEELEEKILKKAEQLIDSRTESKITSKISESEQVRAYEDEIVNFIKNTPDYAEYSDLIDNIVEQYPNIDSIEAAYFMAKGLAVQKEQSAKKEKDFAEYQKNMALNASGGYVANGNMPNGGASIDDLIGGSIANTGW